MEPESDDTNKIKKFIKNTPHRFLAPLKFSDKSRFFLSQLINNCKSEFKSNQIFAQTAVEARFIDTAHPFPKSYSYETIPPEIDAKISDHHKYLYKATVNIYGRTYNFNVMLFAKFQKENKLRAEAEEIVNQSCLWLRIGTKYAPAHCSKTVDVFFYMTDEKKVLPSRDRDYVDTIHANTAFTTSCSPNTQITLFRKEEWFKVFIHESFHNLGLDFSQFPEPNAAANAEILRVFPINSDVKLYESYCEMWAEILNVIIINVLKHPRTGAENMIGHIERDMQFERIYSLFQSAKLMNHFGICYKDLFEITAVAKRNQFKEKTAAFSYFVIKSLLMYNIDAFMEWCLVNNQASQIGFKNPDTNVVKYARELVISKYRDPNYLRTIENVEKTCFSPKTIVPNMKFIYENMRMSVFG